MRKDQLKPDLGFEETSLCIPISSILPLRAVTDRIKMSVKYAQIAASIAEVGIIEAPVVVRSPDDPDNFALLDGHLRLAILRERGETEVICLVAKEDEAYTYNKRISRMAIIQEHKMILNAVRKGVSEERLAKALNVNISNIRTKRNLLTGICPEAVALLKNKHIAIHVFTELRFLKPVRQIEAAELMIAMNRFSVSYAKSIVAATSPQMLAENRKRRGKSLSAAQIALMQHESENLEREFRAIEKSYGADHLDLTLALGYVGGLMESAAMVRYLAHKWPEILAVFQKLANDDKSPSIL